MNGDNGESGPRAWGPRLLAPLAFFTAATVLVLIVHSALTSNSERPANAVPTVSAPRAGATSSATTTTKGTKRKRFYRIREGDTLEAIALRFETTVDDLLTLNPSIEPSSLTPGQRIRVR